MLRSMIVLSLLTAGSTLLHAQQRRSFPVSAVPAAPVTGGSNTQQGGVKPYNQVITAKALTQKGMFSIHIVDEHYFFEIPDSLLGRDILIVNRIGKAAAEVRGTNLGYAGDEIGQTVIRLQKGPQDKIYMVHPMLGERATDTAGMYYSLLNNSMQPLIAAFAVKAYGRDSVTGSGSFVIDVTEMITGDNELFYFNSSIKSQLGLGGQMADRSYILGVKSFPMNLEIRALKTYSKMNSAATYELNSSIVLLPAVPMKPRYFDERIGFLSTGYTDYDANPQGVKKISMTIRWRLEPKPEDIEKYRRGELVEPQKPIVFYIDPSTPKRWIPYLVQGVNDWQVAFEKAGFKHAIMAKEAPEDSTWSIDDARHSAIVYKPSAIPNAMAAEVYDPRSGEIIEAHINWYHNIMKLVHDWYQVQAGAIDSSARKAVFDDSLMGQLIRFVSSHEVGHTLGLMHNYGASSTVPTDSLRNKKWVEAHGHTPSIMDYARFNYVAQPEDHISHQGIFPRVGDYDKWAIEWGYTYIPEYNTAVAETQALNKLVVSRLQDKRLFYGAETSEADPRCQNEDLGDDVIKSNTYGIKNLQRIVPQILQWTASPGEGYATAKNLYTEVRKQFDQYIWHVCRIVGGMYYTPKTTDQPGVLYQPAAAALQKRAVQFVNNQLWDTPQWLVSKPLQERAGIDMIAEIKNAQILAFSRLFTSAGMSRLANAKAQDKNAYGLDDLMEDVKKSIWSELYTHRNIDVYRRNLQSLHIEVLTGAMRGQKFPQNSLQVWQGLPPNDFAVPDNTTIIRGIMQELYNDIQQALPFATGMNKYHLEDASFRINKVLKGIQS